jgi:hypothetical protein
MLRTRLTREPALLLEHHEPEVRLLAKDLYAPNGEQGGYEELELRVTADRIQIAPHQERAGHHVLNFLARRWVIPRNYADDQRKLPDRAQRFRRQFAAWGVLTGEREPARCQVGGNLSGSVESIPRLQRDT